MFNITICNDNYEEVKALKEHLQQYSKDHNIKYKLSIYTKIETLIASASKPTDIILLDIKLENKQVVKQTNDHIQVHFTSVEVIYMCDVLKFMLNGFDLKSHRYILKPIKYKSLEDELNATIKNLETKDIDISFDAFDNQEELPKEDIDLEGLDAEEIYFIEGLKKECIAVTADSEIKLLYNINYLEKNLNSDLFLRCSKDYIINLRNISKIGKYFVVSNGYEILVPKKNFKELKDKLKIILDIK